jgi:hypothetical protein
MLKFMLFDAKVHGLIYFLRFALKFMQVDTEVYAELYRNLQRVIWKMTQR